MGNAGQLDYAAANGYMDAFMIDRAAKVDKGHRHGRSLSINWPLWDSDGMQVDDVTRENLFKAFKVKPLPVSVGLDALKQAMQSEQPQIVVLYGNKKAISTMFEPARPSETSSRASSAPAATDKLGREIARAVRVQTGEHLKRNHNQLDETADWAEFGFDSILLSSFINRINNEFNLNLMPTVLFEATSMKLFTEYLAENHAPQMAMKLSSSAQDEASSEYEPESVEPELLSADSPDPDDHPEISSFVQGLLKSYKASVDYRDKDIAIVGMSCRVAGARTLDGFWKMLNDEKDMISEIPSDRWNWKDYPECSKWGSFIEGVAEFDPLFFGISPAEAMYMAPEQRLMMEYVWECLEDAGCGGDDVKGTNTALFIGCGLSGYQSILSTMPVEAYSATGMVPSVGPNRISYLMDWHGPSNPVDTACSSTLVAVHRAVEAIRAGHCDQAIAGGVNLLLTPDVYISFSKSGMLCKDGRCKTFSDKANGYVRGEGVGMMMLKPLKAAIRDGNSIYALVKGAAENHGGRTNSLTAPNPKSQAAVIKKAIQDADMDFSRIGYIECHGTGTELGDPVEINGLKFVAKDLLGYKSDSKHCRLGSVKSNIGHLEYAAGAVGMIKAVLQIKHKRIAKTLHCEKISPYIELDGTPFLIAQEACDWHVEPGQTRVAGVSSFGFGGVNAHIVLEEFKHPEKAIDDGNEFSTEPQLLVLSAKSEESLFNYVARFSEFLNDRSLRPGSLKDIAYTLQCGRSEMSERVVFLAESPEQWFEQMSAFLESRGDLYHQGIYRGSVSSGASGSMEVGDTRAGQDYIKGLIDGKELEKLAELWVKGTKLDWRALHA